MAKGYVIFTEVIHDAEGMEAYSRVAATSLAGSRARVLALDRRPQVLEGAWPATQTVVLEFESVDAARTWYTSDSYQAAAELRHAAADCDVVILSGLS